MSHTYGSYEQFVEALEARPPEWSPLFWLSRQGPSSQHSVWMLRWLRERCS